jgi:exopolysaccharide production protein ExoY
VSSSGFQYLVRVQRTASVRTSEPGPAWLFLERLVAAAALVAMLPLLAAAALSVVLLSGRSPLVAHQRVGFRGRSFWMLKLRTMWNGRRSMRHGWSGLVEYVTTEGVPGPKKDADPRVSSRLAWFLRRSSIDELPQLVHVLTGRMSLVGPRPLVAAELEAYYGADAEEVLSVRPGVTGLWQVSGRSRLSYRERRRLDLHFVRYRSIGLYLRVLARTLPVVLSARDSW